MTYDEIVAMALEYPGTAESLYYGGPAVKREGRFMFGAMEDGETFVSPRVATSNDGDMKDNQECEQPRLSGD